MGERDTDRGREREGEEERERVGGRERERGGGREGGNERNHQGLIGVYMPLLSHNFMCSKSLLQ